MSTKEEIESLFQKAKSGDVSILTHPKVAELHGDGDPDKWTTALHILAEQGCLDVLQHPEVGYAKDRNGDTPLHILADKGFEEVFEHPDVNKAKDRYGGTPLYRMAADGNEDAKELLEKKGGRMKWWVIRIYENPTTSWDNFLLPQGMFKTKDDAIKAAEKTIHSYTDLDSYGDKQFLEMLVQYEVEMEGGFEREYGDVVISRDPDEVTPSIPADSFANLYEHQDAQKWAKECKHKWKEKNEWRTDDCEKTESQCSCCGLIRCVVRLNETNDIDDHDYVTFDASKIRDPKKIKQVEEEYER